MHERVRPPPSRPGPRGGGGRRGAGEGGPPAAAPPAPPAPPRARRPRRHDGEQLTDRGRRARVLRPVGDGDKRGIASGRQRQTWIPHSVLPVPAHRPDRGSAPDSTRIVHGRQPIVGCPSRTSGFTRKPF